MVRPQFLLELYTATNKEIRESTTGITQAESLREVIPGVNCLNWLVGHIVVARCNFLMFLGVASIWGRDEIMSFIPGSTPVTNSEEAFPFAQLLADLDRTQEQLAAALTLATPEVLTQVREDRTIAEHLAFYAVHEAQHTGQIEIICRLLNDD